MTTLRVLSLLFLLSCGVTFSAKAEALSYVEVAKIAMIGASDSSIQKAIDNDAFYMINLIGVPVILETLGIDESDKTYRKGEFKEQIRKLEDKILPLLIETSTKKINAKVNGFEDVLKSEFPPDQLPAVMEVLKTPRSDWPQTPLNEKLKVLSDRAADKAEIEYLSDLLPLLKQNGFRIPQRFEDHLSKVKAP